MFPNYQTPKSSYLTFIRKCHCSLQIRYRMISLHLGDRVSATGDGAIHEIFDLGSNVSWNRYSLLDDGDFLLFNSHSYREHCTHFWRFFVKSVKFHVYMWPQPHDDWCVELAKRSQCFIWNSPDWRLGSSKRWVADGMLLQKYYRHLHARNAGKRFTRDFPIWW